MNKSENDKNISMWNHIGITNPMWGVLTRKQKKWEEKEFFNSGFNDIMILTAILQKYGFLKKNNLVLDFGCGVGRLTKHIATIFRNTIGIDISLGMLKAATKGKINSQNTIFVHYNSTRLPFIKSNKLDLIVSIITFQHIIPNLQLKYLQEFSRILNNEGLLYLQVVHGFKNNIKGILLKLFGNRLLMISQKIKYKVNYPIKIYPINKNEFYKYLKMNNLVIIEKTISSNTGNLFQSYTYLIQKKKYAHTNFNNIKH